MTEQTPESTSVTDPPAPPVQDAPTNGGSDKAAEIPLEQVMLTNLVEQLEEHEIRVESASLDEIAKEWLGEKETIKESSSKSDQQLLSEIRVGIDLWSFLSLKQNFRDIFSTGTEVAHVIRTKVSDNARDEFFDR